MQLGHEALSLQKDAAVLGTYESNAFILSLRRRDEFSTTHSFGYHRVPHIGVYGSDYTLALPMALLSLPPTPRYLEKLPQDVLNALELGHLTGSLTTPPPPSPLHLLSQRIVSNLHSHYHLTPDLQLRLIARELVKFSITSALSKLGLPAPQTPLWPKSMQSVAFNSASFIEYEPLQDKRPSVVSMGSPSSVDSEEQEDSSKLPKKVSIQVEGTVIEEVEFEDEWREDELEKDWLVEEDALRLVAKKIVKKALRLACKRWESMNRRSSIEYLITSTKRLKIASPSPPPTLPEEERALYEHGIATSGRSSRGWDTPSPNPEMGHGKKRNRSESHNIMMMKELELFRQTQVTLAREEEEGERVIAKPRRREGDRKDAATGFKSGPFLKQESMGELIFDINRLSLQKAESESEECYSSEEDCTVMSGITNPMGRRSSSPSPIPPPNSPTLLQVMRGGVNRSPSPLLHTMLPTALRQVPEWDYSLEHEEQATCTSPEFQQRLSALQPTSETMVVATASCPDEPFLMATKDTSVPDMDYYIILHTCPPPGECQKFMCGNTDEVNLLYHCWLYSDVPCDPSIVCSEPLDMGVFQPRGVTPVHQDLQDAGVAFHHLQPRTVCIHSCHFSPENAQLQLSQNQRMHTFFSAARHGTRRVVALHLIPGSGEVEELLREGLGKCSTLSELLHQLSLTTPGSTQIIRTLVLP